jgi:hypothetical protein
MKVCVKRSKSKVLSHGCTRRRKNKQERDLWLTHTMKTQEEAKQNKTFLWVESQNEMHKKKQNMEEKVV